MKATLVQNNISHIAFWTTKANFLKLVTDIRQNAIKIRLFADLTTISMPIILDGKTWLNQVKIEPRFEK
jgi:hypothetical protein